MGVPFGSVLPPNLAPLQATLIAAILCRTASCPIRWPSLLYATTRATRKLSSGPFASSPDPIVAEGHQLSCSQVPSTSHPRSPHSALDSLFWQGFVAEGAVFRVTNSTWYLPEWRRGLVRALEGYLA